MALQICVQTPVGKTISLVIAAGDIIRNVKVQIEYKEGIPVDRQRLSLAGTEMDDSYAPHHYNLENGSTIHLTLLRAPDSEPRWDLVTLHTTRRALEIMARVDTLMVTMLRGTEVAHHLASLLEEIERIPRELWKTETHDGVIYRRGHKHDDGNFRYKCMVHILREYSELPSVCNTQVMTQRFDDVFLALAARYPSLAPLAVDSPSSLSMYGDIIEFVLADVRMTGRAVPTPLTRVRIAIGSHFRALSDALEEQEHILCSEYVTVARRPQTADVVRTMLAFAVDLSRENPDVLNVEFARLQLLQQRH